MAFHAAMMVGLPPQVRGDRGRRRGDRGHPGLTPAGAGRSRASSRRSRASRAYPRRCGENPSVAPLGSLSAGLPPQVRGEPGPVRRDHHPAGLTPAGAGRTPAIAAFLPADRAYPRRCGENGQMATTTRVSGGLPPQVRGERPVGVAGGVPAGLTPAGAGRTSPDPWPSSKPPAYPRRCGENGGSEGEAKRSDGLPPQVRGELVAAALVGGGLRLTPAGAGRTTRSRTGPWPSWAYPRRCGENLTEQRSILTTSGLPPQVRGERQPRGRQSRRPGLTPAGAGRTDPEMRGRVVRWAYPRRCGENSFGRHQMPLMRGLPPQVRGELKRSGLCGAWPRLTPAGAGRTCRSPRSGSPPRAYPRRCGENHHYKLDSCLVSGLPPQVRGERHHRR